MMRTSCFFIIAANAAAASASALLEDEPLEVVDVPLVLDASEVPDADEVALDVPWMKVSWSPIISTFPASPLTISPILRVEVPDITGVKMKSKFCKFSKFNGAGAIIKPLLAASSYYLIR